MGKKLVLVAGLLFCSFLDAYGRLDGGGIEELEISSSSKSLSHAESACTAEVQQGTVFGEWFSAFPSCTYLGVPFAKPPVNDLRFRPPQAPDAFPGGRLNATSFGPGCIQTCTLQHEDLTCPKETSEDCLFLNVFAPKVEDNIKLPVMFYMHGGNYVGGSGGVDFYHGSRWAFLQKVVMVTVNYRLGALGGLYTKKGYIQGNFQLQDQRIAMKWVQDNIAAFGGDPQVVTILGQSAGGFSTASHLASPKSWQYFQRAIIMSDPVALPTETTSKMHELSKIFVGKVGCTSKIEEEEDECLRSLPADQILEAQKRTQFPTEPGMMLHKFMPWTPVIDGAELPLSPMQAAEQKKLAPVPIMIGTVRNESVQYIWEAAKKPLSQGEYEIFIEAIFGPFKAHKVFKLYGPPDEDQVKKGDVREFLAGLGTDYVFTCSVRHFALKASETNDVYLYHFDHLLSFNEFLQKDYLPECVPFVCHGSDLPILFNTVYLSKEKGHPNETFEEDVLSSQMEAVWSNFAYSGSPNEPNELPRQMNKPAMIIPKFSSDAMKHVSFNIPSEIGENLRAHYCDVFDEIGYEVN